MKKSETPKGTIEIPAINIQTFNLRLVGDSPLIIHAWSEKAKRMILDKQQKKANKAKDVRRPSVEFADSLYWLTPKPNFDGLTDDEVQELLADIVPKSKFGFPTRGFKASAIDGAYQQDAIGKKTTARGAFHIIGEFAEIEGIPTIREDMVKIGMGTADLRYRAEFITWATTLNIKYNKDAMSIEQIVNLFNIGGFSNGVGESRPARNGQNGTYHVE